MTFFLDTGRSPFTPIPQPVPPDGPHPQRLEGAVKWISPALQSSVQIDPTEILNINISFYSNHPSQFQPNKYEGSVKS